MSTPEDTDRTPAEDLALIRRLMDESGKAVDAGGPFLVLWGVLVAAALLATWAYTRGALALSPTWIWGVAVAIGWIASLWLGRRRERRAPVRTTGGRVMAGIWVGGGVTMTLFGFVGIGSGALTPTGHMAATAGVLGACSFASSFVVRSTAYRWLAVGWWLGAIAIFLWPGPHALLVMTGLIVALLVAPGLWLLSRGREAAVSRSTA